MPRPIDLQMLFHILHQLPDPFAGVIACTFIMDIAKGALNRIGARAVGGQIQQLKARMGRQPLLDFLGLVNLGIVNDHREVRIEAAPGRFDPACRGGPGRVPSVLRYQTQCVMVPVVMSSAPPK